MAAMVNPPPAALVPQPTWVPYEPTRDCSQGLCSMYCPQWCYFIVPPPPPAFDIAGPGSDGGDDSSGPAFSPLVIAIIGVLASAFLLVSYYTIISKYCGTFSSLWNRIFGSGSGGAGRGHGADSSTGQQQDPWNVSPSEGMDETLINKITVCKYKRGDGFVVDGTDCSVCLGEFRDGESLRLLPKCSHAFHLPCIDPWLKSHSSCPLCRCNIAVGELEGRAAASPRPRPREDRRDHEFVLTIGDYSPASPGQAREEPAPQPPVASGNDQGAKDERPGRSGEANGVVEIREDGARTPSPVSVQVPETQREARMSIADVLQASLEDELTVAREGGLLAGSSRRFHGEHSKVPADAANPPAPTKRLPPVGRSCFSSKSGRGKDSVPPM